MPRYTVQTDKIPAALRHLGFRAWIADAQHPDGTVGDASCAWSQDPRDAERIAAALNRDVDMQLAVSALRPKLHPVA